MTRPPDRFGLRRSSITTARGRFRHWYHNHRAALAQLASALQRLEHGTSRGAEDERAGMWGNEVPEQHTGGSAYWVAAPDRMRSESRDRGSNEISSVHMTDENGQFWWSMWPSGSNRNFNPWSDDPWIGNPRHEDPLGELAVNALLYPGWRYRGLTEVDRWPVTSALGRPATEVDLVRTLPWSDPRTLGTDDWPWDIEDAELVQVIEDSATGAVVEWRALFQGGVYERHWWDELELNVDLDPALFDGDIEPALAPWEGPFLSTVLESPPASPPVMTIEDVANPSIRQAGLLVGGTWNQAGERVEQHAQPGHPVPRAVGPFGRDVVLRLAAPAPPAMANVFPFDANGLHIPLMLTVLGDRVTSNSPVAGRFDRQPEGTVAAALTLPDWTGRLHLRIDVKWFGRAGVDRSLARDRVSAEYAFTLDTSP